MLSASEDRRVRALRPPKPAVDAWRAHGVLVEPERRPDGRIEQALTIFLAGAECPFTCTFCDLWRYTIDGATPAGALPKQIAGALDALAGPRPDRIKLYNASNFFDRRAVPVDDVPAIAGLCDGFSGVTVESHASTVGEATLDFARRIAGRLEVAMGLETVHPDAMSRINKRIDVPRFDRAVAYLRDRDIDVRVFVLLGAPHVPAAESVEWTVRTVEHAAGAGANVIAIIPVRGGNGELERLQSMQQFAPPTLAQLEAALEGSLREDCVVTADLWDAERLPGCAECRASRVERLRQMNLALTDVAKVRCVSCE